MPELPDVEVFRRYMDITALHKEIERVDVRTRKILRGVSARRLKTSLRGRRFESTARHGKHLLARTDDGQYLALHFGMTGCLKYFRDLADGPDHDRMLISFTNGYHLAYVCQRMLGGVGLAERVEGFVEREALGPDALSFDLMSFKEALQRRRGSIKSALMNQKIIAGIGNIYSDEILFHSGIRPKTPAARLDEKKLEELFRNMKRVLRKAIDCRVAPARLPNSYQLPHRRRGGRCPRCGAEWKQVKVTQRTAYYCPRCQPR